MDRRNENQGDFRRTQTAGSEVIDEYECQLCIQLNGKIEAVGFCVDCSYFLCDTCFKHHILLKPLQHRTLLNIEEVVKGIEDFCTEKCPKHKEKLEYFCPGHDCLGCTLCKIQEHRDCKNVQRISEVAIDTANGIELSRFMAQLDMVLLQAGILSATSRKNKLRSGEIPDKALQDIKQMRKEVDESFDNLEKEMKAEGDKIKQKDKQKMDKNIATCESVKMKADKLLSSLRNMKQTGQNCHLFITMKLLEQKLQEIAKSNTVSTYVFQPREQLKTFVNYRVSLGQLMQEDEEKTRAAKTGEVNVRMEGEHGACRIYGLAMITSERLVAVDRENEKLKLIDTHGSRVISEFKLGLGPWDITSTEMAEEVAITVPCNQKVHFLRLSDDRLHQHKEIKTSGRCYGVASVQDKLVVSLSKPERLEIIDQQGVVLHTIDKDETGKQLFSNVWSLTVNQDTGTIYVSNRDNNTVKSVSVSGQVKGI